MDITTKLIPQNKYNRPGTKQTPKKICVHYFGNANVTAAKLNEYQTNVANGVFANKPESWTSSQYVVGMAGEIIQSVPDDEISYSATGNNQDVIHIECAHPKPDGQFTEATITALGELVRYLMSKYNIAADKVVRHYDLTGKLCPLYYVDNTRWAALHERISAQQEASEKLYRVQIGAFSVRENAENYLAQAKAKDFDGFVIKVSSKLYRVQVGAFRSKANAEAYMQTVKKAGFSAFVVEVED